MVSRRARRLGSDSEYRNPFPSDLCVLCAPLWLIAFFGRATGGFGGLGGFANHAGLEDLLGLGLGLRLDRGQRRQLAAFGLGRGAVAIRDEDLHQLVVRQRVLRVERDGLAACLERGLGPHVLLDQRAAVVGRHPTVLGFELRRLGQGVHGGRRLLAPQLHPPEPGPGGRELGVEPGRLAQLRARLVVLPLVREEEPEVGQHRRALGQQARGLPALGDGTIEVALLA